MSEKDSKITLEFLTKKINANDKEFVRGLMNPGEHDSSKSWYENILRNEEKNGLLHVVRVCSAMSLVLFKHTTYDDVNEEEKERTNRIAINICKKGTEYGEEHARKVRPEGGAYREPDLSMIYLCYGLALSGMKRYYAALEYLQHSIDYGGLPEECENDEEKKQWYLNWYNSTREYCRLLLEMSTYMPPDVRVRYVTLAKRGAKTIFGIDKEFDEFVEHFKLIDTDGKEIGDIDPVPQPYESEDGEDEYRDWVHSHQLFLSQYSSLRFSKEFRILMHDDLYFEFGGELRCQHLFYEIMTTFARCRWQLYLFKKDVKIKMQLDRGPKAELSSGEKKFIERSYFMDYCSNGINTDAPIEYQRLMNCNIRLYSLFDKMAMLINLYWQVKQLPYSEKNSKNKKINFKKIARRIKTSMEKNGTKNLSDVLMLRVAELSGEINPDYAEKDEKFYMIYPNAERMDVIRNSLIHGGVQLIDHVDKHNYEKGTELLPLSIKELTDRTWWMLKICKEMILSTVLAFEVGKIDAGVR